MLLFSTINGKGGSTINIFPQIMYYAGDFFFLEVEFQLMTNKKLY